MRVSVGLLVAMGLGLGGCSVEEPQGPGEPLRELPRELSAAERAVVAGANDFTFALLGRVAAAETGPNVVLSPLSASMALGMLLNGATGETRAEMERALRLEGLDAHATNGAYRDLIELLTGLDDDVAFEIANAVWAREGVPFEPTFLDTAVGYFDATVRALDFDDPGAPDIINGWVSEHTRGRIEKMVETIDPATVMYLMNAIYFKGDWTRPFDPELTRDSPFRRADGSTVTVPMMQMEETRHAVARLPDATVLDLSYARGAFSMTLVLPPEDVDAMDYAASLDAGAWNELVAGLDSAGVMVMMPRFTLAYERTLNGDLQALGMVLAFTDDADFDALTPWDVFVNAVKQKTFIAVDEIGTEAAAVTSVEIRVTSLPPSVILDRPFLFAIRERFSGTILFVGVIGDPTAGD